MARGSLKETQHWLRRAFRRGLSSTDDVKRIKPIIDELAPKLNAFLKSIGDIPEAARADEVSATDN
jgi:four helix bundle protein